MQVLMLGGNLTADAKRNSVSDEKDALNFTVVVNDGYTDKEGNWVETPTYHECSLFVDKGEGTKMESALMRGRFVELEGQLVIPKEGRKATNGKTYHNCFIRVNRIERFGAKPTPKAEVEAAGGEA